ncbi:hypothetical protein T07_7441 [Trichinella nelsoni]|uniref:Uncharacterized protein n=1 Tax=Trichinella nelsoni TaxID=6336 RepID=A0A0V0RK60_9BILA|nr:hypothetical protein T07_7441 [Trichinella nelsoni]
MNNRIIFEICSDLKLFINGIENDNSLCTSNFTICCCIGKFDSITIRDLITCSDRRLQRKTPQTAFDKL